MLTKFKLKYQFSRHATCHHYQCAAKEEVAGAEVKLSSAHLTSTGSHVLSLPLFAAIPKYPEGYVQLECGWRHLWNESTWLGD